MLRTTDGLELATDVVLVSNVKEELDPRVGIIFTPKDFLRLDSPVMFVSRAPGPLLP